MEDQLARAFLAHDSERRELACVLHDVVGHSLSRVLLELEGLEGTMSEQERARVTAAIKKRLGSTVDEVGRLARALHAPAVDELGLREALEQLADDFGQQHAVSVQVVEQTSGAWAALSRRARRPVFRCVQEALLNVAQHARATQVKISVERVAQRAVVCIEDDGIGIDTTLLAEVMSKRLLGIRARLTPLSGSLHVASEPGRGTTLSLEIPLEPVQ